jgi:hypothetical protein
MTAPDAQTGDFREYTSYRPQRKTLELIEKMNGIIREYTAQGYRLSVRQLFYQCVARGIVENTAAQYRRIVEIANNARMGGLMAWDAIEDRGREFIRRASWPSAADLLDVATKQFHMDMWHGQVVRPFVVVEKDALVGILERACRLYDVPLLASRGYPSVTILREFALDDIVPTLEAGQDAVIIHLADHDPSGVDMTRDLAERLYFFVEDHVIDVRRIALSLDQVKELRLPPNRIGDDSPNDHRARAYVEEFGTEDRWELDALPPDYLARLTKDEIEGLIDDETWQERREEIEKERTRLKKATNQLRWEDISS